MGYINTPPYRKITLFLQSLLRRLSLFRPSLSTSPYSSLRVLSLMFSAASSTSPSILFSSSAFHKCLVFRPSDNILLLASFSLCFPQRSYIHGPLCLYEFMVSLYLSPGPGRPLAARPPLPSFSLSTVCALPYPLVLALLVASLPLLLLDCLTATRNTAIDVAKAPAMNSGLKSNQVKSNQVSTPPISRFKYTQMLAFNRSSDAMIPRSFLVAVWVSCTQSASARSGPALRQVPSERGV